MRNEIRSKLVALFGRCTNLMSGLLIINRSTIVSHCTGGDSKGPIVWVPACSSLLKGLASRLSYGIAI